MTEIPAAKVQSQDYWDIVLNQLKKRFTVLISLTVLVFLYAAAIYAPLLANDRPLYFRGVDFADYRKAQRELALGARGLADRLEKGASDTSVAELEREREAVMFRIGLMRLQLAEGDHTLLNELEGLLDGLISAARAGNADVASAAGTRVSELVTRIRAELRPAKPDEPAVPGQTVQLVPYAAYPVFENLGRGDAFFMSMWVLVLTWPIWNRIVNGLLLRGSRLRIRRARKWKLLSYFAIPLVVAILWQGEPSQFYASSFKARLSKGDVIAQDIVFPIIPYGIAESSDSENFRPPTWHPHAAVSEDGYYELGPRSGRTEETTGLPILAEPVDVKFAELDRNHPLRHAMGTDSLGRDILARVVWGARVSLAVGLVSTLILVILGTIVGSIAGYYGGMVDTMLSRVIEIVQTFPVFFLILILVAFVGPSILNIMVVIGLVRWTGVARLVRGEFIRLREQDFVVASQALGVRSARTIFRHVLPNAMSPVLVAATFSVAAGILIESGLSFLGFGIQLPIPSWGSLFIESRSAEHWWIQIFPGILIFLTVLLYNLLGEGVRDALDPRLKGSE